MEAMTTLSSSDVRELGPKIEAVTKQIAEYLSVKEDTRHYESDIVITYISESEIDVIDLSSYDQDYGNADYKIPLGIFDSWANTITQLKYENDKKKKAAEERAYRKSKEEYERLKEQFEGTTT